MREKGAWSEVRYAARASAVAARGGTATYEGEQRVRQGKGLDSLVDPKERGVIRESNNLLIPEGKRFVLKYGVAMPVETDFDTTASMGRNVDIAFRVQPKLQNLLVQGKNAVLKRYHTQIATGSIGDLVNRYPYQRSQFEPDNEVERQMGLLVPERDGGTTTTEDYQLSLFALAYLSKTSIVEYGLRGYYFPAGDERGRDEFDPALLERVFGPTVYEKAFGKKPRKLPGIEETAKKVLEGWHGFFLQVYSTGYTTRWWSQMFGSERVVILPRTEDLAEVQATIIGLTEGVLDLQNAYDFLREAKVEKEYAKRIVEACRGIPLGLQKTFPNFNKIPMAGAVFASREDIWPVKATADRRSAKDGAGKKNEWQL